MRYSGFLFGILCSAHAFADLPPPVVPLNQNLAAVDYFREGRQSGCGLRITGETKENVWLNVLITVMIRESGTTLGLLKVSAKKINMKDGSPVLQDGRLTYSSIGKIHKAWIKTESGVQPIIYKNGESWHGDSYMTSMEFAGTMDLLATIPQASVQVGFNKDKGVPDQIFEFNRRINQDEAGRLFACMKNLRGTIEENRSGKRL